MTRPLLTLMVLTATLLFSGVIADSPAPAAAVGMARSVPRPPQLEAPVIGIRLGERILQIRIRACGTCRSEVSIRIELPGFTADLLTR